MIHMQKATFGAGCFWGVQHEFDQLKGVEKTTVGYMGGKTKNPSYKEVCTNTTGHAEVVHIEYDENIISYQQLLDLFWDVHNPTQLNRQGPDVGSQYRSIIFYHSEEQRKQAEKSKEKQNNSTRFNKEIVTEIVEATDFYAAEEYHQHYFKKHGVTGCHI